MNNTNIDIADYFKIHKDKSNIRGFIVIKDSENHTILKKENMIVKTGRLEILKKLFSTGGSMPTRLYIGDGETLTTPVMTLSDIHEISSISSELTDLAVAPIIDTEKLYLKITHTITISGPEKIKISEAGLRTDTILFSRVVFDPVYLDITKTYTLNYYIYF